MLAVMVINGYNVYKECSMNEIDSTSGEIVRRLEESILIKQAVAKSKISDIEDMAKVIIAAYKAGGKVVLFGNGGSASDAQHIACELIGRFALKRRAFPAIALTANTSTLTAIANDYGYNEVFSRQVEALVDKRDVVIGISTSGDSPNVVKAIEMAKAKGARTIALTGGSGGKLAKVADIALVVPSDSTPRIQEVHITIGHIVCEIVEKELSGNG